MRALLAVAAVANYLAATWWLMTERWLLLLVSVALCVVADGCRFVSRRRARVLEIA